MTFVSEKNVAIVWFAKSSLQLAFTVDDSKKGKQSTGGVHNEILPLKMEQLQPLNEKQHFTIHSILPENFPDSFLRIESLSHPGYFLDFHEDDSNDKSIITVFLSHESQNKKKWQFIDGQLRCNNGKSVIIFDEKNTYSLKAISMKCFNCDNDNKEDFNNSNHDFISYMELYEESIFHFCFYDGNSLPEQVPIIFYSPLYNKVITSITYGDLNNGGRWLRLEKFDSHMPSQVWIYNLTHQNDIRSSVVKEQAFDYYNDGRRYLLYTHLHHGRPNQQWDYTNYKLITHELDHLIVEYDEDLKELKMREDVEKKENINTDENSKSKNILECDIFGCSNAFLVFLSNQRNMFDFSPDLDSSYLYNIIINRNSSLRAYKISNNELVSGDNKPSWISFDEFRGNIWDDYQQTLDYEKDYNFVSFKDNPGKVIKFRNVQVSLNNRYNYYDLSTSRYDFTKIKNWKDFNYYLNNKISISSDQRIFIPNVQLSENTSITFSLIMKGELLSRYKKKSSSINTYNNNSRRNYDIDEDLFDINSDEENINPVYYADLNENQQRMSKVDRRFAFNNHKIKSRDKDKENWQPEKPRFPDSMKNLQIPQNEQNNHIYNNDNNFLPFIGFNRFNRRRVPHIIPNNNLNDNNTEANDNNEDNQDLRITYFDTNDITFKIDPNFIQLLNGSSITITKENSDECRLLGNQLGITGMVEIANFVDSFSPQFAHLSDLSEIQRELMDITDTNYETLAANFSRHIQNDNYSTICWLILSVSITKPLQNDSLAKFCQILLSSQPPEFKEEFKKAIIRDFKSIHTNLFFYRKIYLYCKDLFSQREMKKLVQLRKEIKNEIIFFSQEFPEFQTNLTEIDQNELNHFIETGFNSNRLLQIIRDDNVDEFQKIFIADRINPNKHILNNNLERIPLLNHSPNLIQYSAFFGSVKIFKFLLLQQADLNHCDMSKRTAFTFALAGGNTEIIHIIHQELTKNKNFNTTTDLLRNAIMFGQNDVFKWLFSNTSSNIIDNISKRELILEAIISKNINALLDLIDYIYTTESITVHFSCIFDNYEFLKLLYPFYFDNKFSLICDACVSGNVEILKYLIEDNKSDNIILDKSLKKVAIRTAINNDNVDVFKYLATEKDYSSCSNFIYACDCNSLKIIELFVSNEKFDFSNILINKSPLSIHLLRQKKHDALDILSDSKYFDLKDKYNDHSFFYYAVVNELFDLARKVYFKKKDLFDINEENILLDYIDNPKIVEFLVTFPELYVNIKNELFESPVDRLFKLALNGNKEQFAQSMIYLLDRPEVEFNPIKWLFYSINTNNEELFDKIIQFLSNKKSDEKELLEQFNNLLNNIVEQKKINFYIKLIKSGLISIDEKVLVHQCIIFSSPKVYHEILHDKLPKEKEIKAVYYSIAKSDYECFSYLMSINSINFNLFNNYILGSDQTVLTFAIKKAKDTKIIEQLLSNKFIDVNKPNKMGETPFLVALQSPNKSISEIFLKHPDIKFTFTEFECAFKSQNKTAFECIINHMNNFIDDPQKITQILIETKNVEYLHLLSNYTDNIKENIFLSPLLVNSVKCNLKSFFKSDLQNKVDLIDINYEDNENKGATALCYAIHRRGIYFYNCLKNFHPLLLTNNFDKIGFTKENRITPFGNVRSIEVATEMINLFFKKNIPINLLIKEICGLNVEGQTALYRSIVDNNFILFDYLLKLTNELNQKLKDKSDLIDALIYTKNKDGTNPFFAVCMNKNWKLFINHLMDKMINLSTTNNGYFGKFNPLSAAILSRNYKLIDILLSKGFTIDHFSFCQIIRMNLMNSIGERLLKSNPDFQFDLFMPLHLIQDEKLVENLFIQKKINFDFRIKDNLSSDIDDYLLISAIRNRDEKLINLVLNNCGNDYEKIMFDWRDFNGKTALHYAIEKSMTKVVYRLIEIFTNVQASKSNRFEFFFIEDKNGESPIHYLFKSFNEDYIFFFYKNISSLLNLCDKAERLNPIFNSPTLINKRSSDQINAENKNNENTKERTLGEENAEDILSQSIQLIDDGTASKIENPNNQIIGQKVDQPTKETLLTFSIKNNKVKFINFILENIPEIDPNVANSCRQTPLQLSISNVNIFELLIENCSQKVKEKNLENHQRILDVNKNGIAFSVLEINDSKTATFCMNLLLKCQSFDINQKKTIQGKEISLIDLFINKIENFDLETQKTFLYSTRIDFNSNPENVFKLISFDLKIPLIPIISRLTDDTIRNARTNDDEKDTIATFSAKNLSISDSFYSLMLDRRIDFANSRNTKGKSAIDILTERGQTDTIELIDFISKAKK